VYERRIDRAARHARRVLIEIGDELRRARISAGLTLREVGALVRLSHTQISRIERGLVPGVGYATLVLIAAVVGLKLPLRAYPGDDPVRDAPQLAVLGRFRKLVAPSIRHRTEVPLGIPGDLRAWDEVMVGDGWMMPVEAESRIGDTQALRRRLALKCRDGGVDALILLVNDTAHNRRAIGASAADFAEAFPISARRALAALRRGEHPTGGAIIFV
jgi:transcriptional regulator with XRE-family HTH domain